MNINTVGTNMIERSNRVTQIFLEAKRIQFFVNKYASEMHRFNHEQKSK